MPMTVQLNHMEIKAANEFLHLTQNSGCYYYHPVYVHTHQLASNDKLQSFFWPNVSHASLMNIE